MDDKQFIRQIRKAIKRLMVLGGTYFRFLHWCIECHTAPDPDQMRPFALGRQEILAMGFDTVQSFRGRWEQGEYNPSEWEEVKCIVVWNKHRFTSAGHRRRVKPYRDDLAFLPDSQDCGELTPIPRSAKVKRIELLQPPERVPFELIYERIGALVIQLERVLPTEITLSHKWPGKPSLYGYQSYTDVRSHLSMPGVSAQNLRKDVLEARQEYEGKLSFVYRLVLTIPYKMSAQRPGVPDASPRHTSTEGTGPSQSVRTEEQILAALETLPPAARKAYASYEFAVRKLEEIGQSNPTDKEVYAYLEESPPEDYALPKFTTWSGHLRRARKALGEQKKRPRNAATASMAKVSDDPDILSQISNKYVRGQLT